MRPEAEEKINGSSLYGVGKDALITVRATLRICGFIPQPSVITSV